MKTQNPHHPHPNRTFPELRTSALGTGPLARVAFELATDPACVRAFDRVRRDGEQLQAQAWADAAAKAWKQRADERWTDFDEKRIDRRPYDLPRVGGGSA